MGDFLPEDGTGVEGANAYITVAYARAYFLERGQLADWEGAPVGKVITGADAGANTITVPAHGILAGDGPIYLVGVDLPAGLAQVTPYWPIVVDADTLKLAADLEDAIADPAVPIDITDAGTGSMLVRTPDFAALREAIVRATDYIEQIWGLRFKGVRSTAEQGLHWPALQAWGVVAGKAALITGVPDAVKRACAEYALRAKSKDLQAASANAGAVTSKSITADGITKSETYASPSSMTSYPIADGWLRPLIAQSIAVRY